VVASLERAAAARLAVTRLARGVTHAATAAPPPTALAIVVAGLLDCWNVFYV
jgi:hypothetical protein